MSTKLFVLNLKFKRNLKRNFYLVKYSKIYFYMVHSKNAWLT